MHLSATRKAGFGSLFTPAKAMRRACEQYSLIVPGLP
jgi:hypothetical protein